MVTSTQKNTKQGKNMKEEILEILNEIREDVDFEEETSLIDDGVLTSLDVVAVVSELNDAFDIEISADDLLPENFNSLDAICNLVANM
jgi:D-alanine--poly(phosphoribitol) ligase subunit 2